MSALAIIKPEEHDRQKFIGGADIAAVMGLSKWRTRVDLWKDKSTPRLAEAAAPASKRRIFKRGKRWESVVAEMLVETLTEQGHAVEIVGSNVRYRDQLIDYFAAEIDFELRLDGAEEITNCELKTVHPFASREWGESESDELPVSYTAQAMWGLGVTGRERCIVAPLFGADEIRTYTVERDDQVIAALRTAAMNFWLDHVLTGLGPEPVALADLETLYPKDSERPALVADEDLTATLLRMRAIDREIKARTAEFESLEFQVKRVMRDAGSIVVGDGKEACTWKTRPYSWLDQAALKEAHPKLAREFTRKKETRTFALKPFAIDGVL